jgi:coenzyme Q-binding protein COQ10
MALIIDKILLYKKLVNLPQKLFDLIETYNFKWNEFELELSRLGDGNFYKSFFKIILENKKNPLWWIESRAVDEAKIIEKISEENLRADLLINFKNFFEKYRSDVKHGKTAPNAYFVDVVAIEGPFKSLVNKWKIRDFENGKCEVEFFIEFEFNSIILTKLIGTIFARATEKMMAAFEARAQEIYSN